MRWKRALHASTAALAVAAAVLTAPSASADNRAPASSWEISLSGESAATVLRSVSSVSDSAAWAAGSKEGYGVLMRWDGSQWSQESTTALPTVWEWSSVSAVSAQDVWAYGSVGFEGTVAHYDGQRWSVVPAPATPDRSFPDVPIEAVHGRVFMGGSALHTYQNGAWQTFELPAGVHIRDISAASADDAYATGMVYPVEGGRPVTYHWDGTSWTEMQHLSPPVATQVDKLAVESPDSIYVAGSAWNYPYAAYVAHWNGTRWEGISAEMPDFELSAISTDGRGQLWATGMDTVGGSDPVFWRYDGSGWTRESGATTPDSDIEGRHTDYNFHDLTPVDDTGAMWAVGRYQIYGPDLPFTTHALIERSTPLL